MSRAVEGVAPAGTEPCWEITHEDGWPLDEEFNAHYGSQDRALLALADTVRDDPELYGAAPLSLERVAELFEAGEDLPTVLIVSRVYDRACLRARCAECEVDPEFDDGGIRHWLDESEAVEAAVEWAGFAVHGGRLLCDECASRQPVPDDDRRPGPGQLPLDVSSPS